MSSPYVPDDIMACGSADYDEERCTFGDAAAPHTAVIVGNSIAMTFVNPIREALGEDWRVVSYGRFGCPFADYALTEAPEMENCSERPDTAIAAINSMSPELVFVAGARPVDAAVSELRKITAPSQLVFLPVPPNSINPQECYTPQSSPSDCVSEQGTDWDVIEQRVIQQAGGIELSVDDWFCFEGLCPAFSGTIPTRIEDGHMTQQYGQRLVPVIREALIDAQVISSPE